MVRRIVWAATGIATVFLGFLLLTRPTACYACAQSVPPPDCTLNLSAMTIRQADERKAWWSFFDQREERTLQIYLGLNMNNGTGDMPYSYEIIPSGDWQPSSITPITGTGTLSPGKNNATIGVTIPYSTTDVGDLTLTANVRSPCPFAPPNATTRVRINEQGPTVWPITSRVCPAAGEKPTFRFGVRNPSDQNQTYAVTARALTQFGGDHTPILNDDGSQPGVHRFPDMLLRPNEAKDVEITCETFGFCLTGSESRVDMEVRPAPGSGEQFDSAIASSNITVRDPQASCPKMEDWWFIMPPQVFWGLIAAVFALPTAAAGWYFRPTPITRASDNAPIMPETSISTNPGDSNSKGKKGGPGGSAGATRNKNEP
jgi:hypothetical protein